MSFYTLILELFPISGMLSSFHKFPKIVQICTSNPSWIKKGKISYSIFSIPPHLLWKNGLGTCNTLIFWVIFYLSYKYLVYFLSISIIFYDSDSISFLYLSPNSLIMFSNLFSLTGNEYISTILSLAFLPFFEFKASLITFAVSFASP